MKFYTICYPGEYNQHVQETFSEDQIIESYYGYWKDKMLVIGKESLTTRERCIEDWIVVHWAVETDEFGVKL